MAHRGVNQYPPQMVPGLPQQHSMQGEGLPQMATDLYTSPNPVPFAGVSPQMQPPIQVPLAPGQMTAVNPNQAVKTQPPYLLSNNLQLKPPPSSNGNVPYQNGPKTMIHAGQNIPGNESYRDPLTLGPNPSGPFPSSFNQPGGNIYQSQGPPPSGWNHPNQNTGPSQTGYSQQEIPSIRQVNASGNQGTVPSIATNTTTGSVQAGGIPSRSSSSNLSVLSGPSSEPNSARSSRNPSPIPTRSYDTMEGQFQSPRPSPVSSSNNIQALGQPLGTAPPANSSSQQGPAPTSRPGQSFPNIPPPPSTSTQYRPLAPPSYMGQPGPNPVMLQPQAQGIMGQPLPRAAGPAFNMPPIGQALQAPNVPLSQRSRYPQQQQMHSQQMQNPQQIQNQASYGQGNFSGPPSQSQYGQFYGNNRVPTVGAQSGAPPEGPVGGIPGGYDPQMHARMAGMSIHNSFSRMWGNDSINLLQDRNILPPTPLEPIKPVLPIEKSNCSPDIFRCTLTRIPETSSLLQKSRMPLGILIHPFKDMSHLPVIQCNTIVRCRSCRTYINPFVSFVDQRRWKCNLCYRINDLPEEFFYDPASGTYGDPSRRPEIKNATIEFIAPSEYMLRPPQPAIYLFVLDVSHTAVETGYLEVFCSVLSEELENLPGDARTKIGLITFDSSIHFYCLAEGMNRPHMLVVSDIEEMFVPIPDNLMVNMSENKALLQELLSELPTRFSQNDDTNSALGAALQAAYKMVSPTGGRITVLQAVLPNLGPGTLKQREDPNQRAAKEVNSNFLGPASDFYKKLALDCSGQQVSVDLFLLSSQYADIATLACASKFSAGCINYYPGYHKSLNKHQVEKFENDLRRYLTRKIGFEAVMRIRCTRGLTIHTFHGNFFVRSTDLLSLPNVNPDNGFGMQISIEENLTESNVVCFQAAVLYTSSKGERRIRVHTLSLPVSPNLAEIMGGADQQAIIGLLSKMAVDRSLSSSLNDARDALINACIDTLSAFKVTMPSAQAAGGLMCPFSVRLLPLYVIALLKHPAFRVSISTKLDERVYAMERMKSMPLAHLMSYVYPSLYPVHSLDDTNALYENDLVIPQPPILQLSFEKIDRHGAYLLDTMDCMYLYIGRAISDQFCINVLGVNNFMSIPEKMDELPELETAESNRLRNFINWTLSKRPFHTPLVVMREDSKDRASFLNCMVDDRSESSFSYYEFLQHLKNQISK